MGFGITERNLQLEHYVQVRVPGKIPLGFGYATKAARPVHSASLF